MRKLLLVLGLLFLSTNVYAQDLEYYKVYPLRSGMSADDIMKIVYHNKYSLFAKDFLLPKSEVFYIDPSGFTRTKIAFRERIVEGGKEGVF